MKNKVIILFILNVFILKNTLSKNKYNNKYYRDFIETKPFFPGGNQALEQFIEENRNKNIILPDSLNDFNDTFYSEMVSFDVDSTGKIFDVNIEQWAGYKYTNEDINKILKKMPLWIPGYEVNVKTGKRITQNGSSGINIKYYYTKKHVHRIIDNTPQKLDTMYVNGIPIPPVRPCPGPGYWLNDTFIYTGAPLQPEIKDKTEPEFPGGYANLQQFIDQNRDKNIRVPALQETKNDSFYDEYIYFDVGVDGAISDISITHWRGEKYCIDDINNIINKMPKWLPAYKYNYKTGNKTPFKMRTGFNIKYYFINK